MMKMETKTKRMKYKPTIEKSKLAKKLEGCTSLVDFYGFKREILYYLREEEE